MSSPNEGQQALSAVIAKLTEIVERTSQSCTQNSQQMLQTAQAPVGRDTVTVSSSITTATGSRVVTIATDGRLAKDDCGGGGGTDPRSSSDLMRSLNAVSDVAHARSVLQNFLANQKPLEIAPTVNSTSTERQDQEIYKCAKCDFFTKQKSYLKQHVELVHVASRPFKCPFCDYAGKRSHSLKEHLVVHSTHRPYECNLCNASFRKKGHLTNHIRMHTTQKIFDCNLCGKSFTDRHLLYEHLRGEHPDHLIYPCNKCSYATTVKSNIIMHVHTHGNPTTYRCSACAHSALHMNLMKQHIQASHRGQTVVIQVEESRGGGVGQGTSQSAKAVPTSSAPTSKTVYPTNAVVMLKCTECGFSTASRAALREHMLASHVGKDDNDVINKERVQASGGDSNNVHRCEQCDFSCSDAYALITHMLSHKPRYPASKPSTEIGFSHDPVKGCYFCNLCGYSCDHQRTIKAHIWKHAGEQSLDYPMFQNGPLSIYDETPVGKEVLLTAREVVQTSEPSTLQGDLIQQPANSHDYVTTAADGSTLVAQLDEDNQASKQIIIDMDGMECVIHDDVTTEGHVVYGIEENVVSHDGVPQQELVEEESVPHHQQPMVAMKPDYDSSVANHYDPEHYGREVVTVDEVERDAYAVTPEPSQMITDDQTVYVETIGENVVVENIISSESLSSLIPANQTIVNITSVPSANATIVATATIEDDVAPFESTLKRTAAGVIDEEAPHKVAKMDAVEVEIEAVDEDPDRVVVVEEEDTNLSQHIRDEEEIFVEAHSMEEEEEATSEQKKLKAFIAKAKQVFKTRVPKAKGNASEDIPEKEKELRNIFNEKEAADFLDLLKKERGEDQQMKTIVTTATKAADGLESTEQKPSGISSSLLAVIEQLRERSKSESEGDENDSVGSKGSKTGSRRSSSAIEDEVPVQCYMNVEQTEQGYRCKLCHYTSASTSLMKAHMRLHKVKNQNECSLCNYQAANSQDLTDHMISHCKVRTFECKLCDKVFSYKSQLRAHVRAHNQNPLLCQHCPFETSNPIAFRNHARQHAYSCDRCQATFRSEEDYLAHCKVVCDVTSVDSLHCAECGHDAKDADEAAAHKRNHGAPQIYKCESCDHTCMSYAAIRAHCKTHLLETTILQCDLCDFTATSARSLKSHHKRHVNDQRFVQQPLEQYKCNICGYVCHHLPSLKSHMWKHASDKQYSYSNANDIINAAVEYDYKTGSCVTDRGTPEKSSTPPLIPTATSLVSFRCCQCGFESVDKAVLNAHMKSHLDIIQKTLEVNRNRLPNSRRNSTEMVSALEDLEEAKAVKSQA